MQDVTEIKVICILIHNKVPVAMEVLRINLIESMEKY